MNENNEIPETNGETVKPPIKWNEKTVPIENLTPYERNPRKIKPADYERLKKSIASLGQFAPLIVTPALEVASGHQRLKAFKELGWTEIRVSIPDRDLTKQEFREILIRANVSNGQYDIDMLKIDFEEIELEEWGAGPTQKAVNFSAAVKDSKGFCLLVEFESEKQQQDFFTEMRNRNIPCKILS